VGHALRSSGLLRVEASLASRLSETRRRVVHVAASQRLRQSQVENGRVDATGYIGYCYSCFTVFISLGPRGIVLI
jgi:hypothetical protein